MKLTLKLAGLAIAAATTLPFAAHAHRAWLLPSATVLSGNDPWVTVDAAVSNDLFYFEHVPLRLDSLAVYGPDGSPIKAENQATGKYRSTFDVHLTATGTYKIAIVNSSMFASYEENGEMKRWRGTAEKFATEVPKDAKNLQVTKMQTRNEIFVTKGKPSETVLKTTGVGLELSPITHPNDVVVGEPAKFALLHNGKPAANVTVSVIPGGIRYRDNLKEVKVTTDADGKFTVNFTDPGMYWLNATVTDAKQEQRSAAPQQGVTIQPVAFQAGPEGGPRGPRQGGPGGPGRMPAGNRASYTTTLEVLPQ